MTKTERDEGNRAERQKTAREKQALEEIMTMGLVAAKWPLDAVAGYLAAERLHGVLRPSAPGWLVRSSGETWPEALRALSEQYWILFPGNQSRGGKDRQKD
jgi:hypothetical protein